MPIPINISNLLSRKSVETERIEYKRGWNPAAIYRSICAFANDFDNIGGGYILVGIEEENGRPVRPVIGISEGELDDIQKRMVGFNNLIRPVYHPKIEIENLDKKKILII